MNLFKKLTAISTAVLLGVTALAGCGGASNSASTEQSSTTQMTTSVEYVKQDIEVAALKGPTAIGMVKIMDNAKNGDRKSVV